MNLKQKQNIKFENTTNKETKKLSSNLAPHGALKYVGVNFDQRVGLIRSHFGLLEVAQENCLEHRAARTENQLVALKVLQKKHSKHLEPSIILNSFQ
jgi:hypothetical protein